MEKCKEMLFEPYLKYKEYLQKCRDKEYSSNTVIHKHHIIPKNLDGTNEQYNLIEVSVEDHVKLHLLLSECFEIDTKENIDNLRSARILSKKSITDIETLNKIKRSYLGEKNPFYGKKHSKETIEKIAEANKKRKGKNYDQIYGEKSEIEKQKRRISSINRWESTTDEQKLEIRKKISIGLKESGSQKGSKNGIAKKVRIGENIFGSISEACEYYQINKYFLRKKFNLEIINEKNTKI